MLEAKNVDEERIARLREELETTTEEADEPDEEKKIRCRACRHLITTTDHVFSIDGGHRHTFANPAGIVFEIGCFSAADGCANRGAPTSEFSWFSGYSWRFSLCSRCRGHMGWFYAGEGKPGFYGLILAHLIQ